MSLTDRLRALFERAAQSTTEQPTIITFSADHVLGETEAVREMRPRRDYFEVTVNELFLSYKRQWFKTFDPLVYTVTEFEYGNELKVVPFVVGPQLVETSSGGPPDSEGIVLLDTRVAGPHPLKGERLALTLLLCKLERQDYARGLLRGIERLSGAVDPTGMVTPYLRVAEAMMDGVEEIVGTDSTELLAGLRTELTPPKGISSPTFMAVIAAPAVDSGRLWVRGGRLVHGDSPAVATPYRAADFTLVSLRATPIRSDIDRLPFASVWAQVKREATRSVNKEHWEQRGRPTLFTLAEAIYDSPDLTLDQQDSLIKDYEDRAVILRDTAMQRATLGPGDAGQIAERARSAEILRL